MRQGFFFLPIAFSGSLMLFAGCETVRPVSQQSFTFQDIPIAKGTVKSGEGSSVRFRGSPLALSGPKIQTGEPLRHVQLTKRDLSFLDLTTERGKVRIISVVPSLDTKVCEQQTHFLSEKNEGLDEFVDLYTISIDTPFAQDRFAKESHIANVTFLSDYRGGEFGRAYGLFLEKPHLLARSVIVVDQQNVIRYLQVTPDLAHMPDMEAAFAAARGLTGSGHIE